MHGTEKQAMKRGAVYELELNSQDEALSVCGRGDRHLRTIERETGVQCVLRNSRLTVTGPPRAVPGVGALLSRLLEQTRGGSPVQASDVSFGLMLLRDGLAPDAENLDLEAILTDGRGRPVKPRTPAQSRYVREMFKKDMVICIGPAGTGKTFLAVAMAIKKLLSEQVARIVVCRPAVEAGEKLGFLPGDFQQKVDPYLRPIYDALFTLLSPEKCGRLLERNIIEVAPLAYMRGRTLDDAFAIMDEAQNTTVEQMKMFLTRLGRQSCAVVTGDITQIDLPPGTTSGLTDAAQRLKDVEGLSLVKLSKRDVVRHDLVARIIHAYESGEAGDVAD